MIELIIGLLLIPTAHAYSPSLEASKCMNTPVEEQSESCKDVLKQFSKGLEEWNKEVSRDLDEGPVSKFFHVMGTWFSNLALSIGSLFAR